jgi:guanylate kinase
MTIPPGNLYVIAAPSGTGKTSLVNALVDSMQQVTVSISHTTRAKRPGETHGVHYYFIDENQFKEMIQHGDFLEYATVFHYLYGTSHTWVEATLAKGQDVILEIDWQGCQQIKQKFPDCVSIFILPPSYADLAERLEKRNQDKPEVIQERLADVKETMSHIQEYDYLVLNADFAHAVNDLKMIIESGRLLEKPQTIRLAEIIAQFKKQ